MCVPATPDPSNSTIDRRRDRCARNRGPLSACDTPRPEQVAADVGVEVDCRAETGEHLHRLRGLAAQQRNCHVVECYLFVYCVGFDVLIEEVGRRRTESQTAQTLGVALVGQRRGALQGEEVPDDGTLEPTPRGEQRQGVDPGQRDRGDGVEVRRVIGVESQRRHRPGEERGVHALDPPVAVLVVLDLHQTGFGLSGQAGDGGGVRVGFAQVIERSVPQEVPVLFDGSVAAQMRRQRGCVQLGQVLADPRREIVCTAMHHRTNALTDRPLQRVAEAVTHGGHIRMLIPPVGHTDDAAPVELGKYEPGALRVEVGQQVCARGQVVESCVDGAHPRAPGGWSRRSIAATVSPSAPTGSSIGQPEAGAGPDISCLRRAQWMNDHPGVRFSSRRSPQPGQYHGHPGRTAGGARRRGDR